MEIIEEMISTYVHMRVSEKWKQELSILLSTLKEKVKEIVSIEQEREKLFELFRRIEVRLG